MAVFLLSLLLACGVFIAIRRPAADVARRLSADILSAGEESDVVLLVRTDTLDPSIRDWRDVVPPSFGRPPAGSASVLREASVGGTVRAAYRILPERRGEFTIGPLILTGEDPFRLLSRERVSGSRTEVVVTPRVHALVRSGVLQASGDGARHEHRISSHPRVDELIAREYRAGDPMRRIHWRATARRGELMVRQEEQEVDPSAVLVLDTAAPANDSASPGGADFERMVELAASIGTHALAAGFRLTLVESVQRDSDPSRRFEPTQSADLLRRLAVVVPVPADEEAPDIAVLTRDVLARAGAPVPVFAVLGDTTPSTLRRLGPLARSADPAVAFTAVPHGERDGALRSAGWVVGALHPSRSIADVWNDTLLTDPVSRSAG